MVDQGKAIDPVRSVILSPLNEGGDFFQNSYITFRIGKSDVNMWLTNDSYLSFDLVLAKDTDLTYKTAAAINDGSTVSLPNMYIRNACNVFEKVEVTYGGNKLYYQAFNIEMNTIKMLSYGESYLNSNYATYTTRKSIADGTDYLKISPDKFTNSTGSAIAANSDFTYTLKQPADQGILIKNIMIPINQLIPIFQDVTADGFPIRNLDNQIEIRLYLASPHRYLCNWNHALKDFATTGKLSNITFEKLTELDASLKLSNVRMYNSYYVPDSYNEAVFDNKCSSGWKFKYNDWIIGLRQISEIKHSQNLLPFNIVTQNTKSLLVYCYNSPFSPSIMYRPEVSSTSIKLGSKNQIPAQPIPQSTFITPFEYKFTVDDVLDNIDKYYAESNMDYNYSYQYIAPATASAAIAVPTSSFALLGANYTNTDQMGSNSSAWNSQYQLSFNGEKLDSTTLTFVLGIQTEYGLIVDNGKLETINL